MKEYAERSEAKKKYIKIKRGPKKLNFGASKPGVRGGPEPLGPPLDPLVRENPSPTATNCNVSQHNRTENDKLLNTVCFDLDDTLRRD